MIDRTEWNDFVWSAGGHIYQTWHWAEVMRELGVDPVPLRARHSVLMAYQGQFMSAHRLGVQLNSLSIERGPVFTMDGYDEDEFAWMVDEVDRFAQSAHVAVCSFSPPLPYDHVSSRKMLEDRGFKYVPNLKAEGYHTQTFLVNLLDSDEGLLKRMEKRTRWSIRKAEKGNVTVDCLPYMTTSPYSEVYLHTFYQLYSRTVPHPQPESFFQTMFRLLGPKGYVRIFIAKAGSVPVSAAFLFLFGKRVWYTWGGSDPKYHSACASSLLHWRIMQWAREHGYYFYDLGGALLDESNDAPAKMRSGTLFKRGFGGAPMKYLGQYRKQYGKLNVRTLKLLGAFATRIYQGRRFLHAT